MVDVRSHLAEAESALLLGRERLAGRLGTRVINVCEFERALAQEFHVCPAKTLEVVHNGIPEIAFAACGRSMLSPR
jgi:hypothetical protein